MTVTTESPEARGRLLRAAQDVFVKVGYNAATTREICKLAGANPGAVNYYFRDKLGLYKEVLDGLLQSGKVPLIDGALLNLPPERALAKFILMMMNNLGEASPDPYAGLMLHELAAPADGLQVVVEKILRPRVLVLCQIVGKLIGKPTRDKRTRMCAHSIVGQVTHYTNSAHVIALLWPDWKFNAAARMHIAEHVTEFSLAALGSLNRRLAENKKP